MAIKHEPKFYVRLRTGKSCEFPEHFCVYPGSTYGRFVDSKGKTTFWVCDTYALKGGQVTHSYLPGTLLEIGAGRQNTPVL